MEPPPLIQGTNDENDTLPYTVPGDPPAPPKESKPPPRPPVAVSWEMNWPLARRVKVYAGLLALNLLAAILSWVIIESVPVSLITLLITSLLQAFLLGTFDRIDLTRSAKGKIALTRAWRIAFYPLRPQSLRWSEFESVSTGKSYEAKIEDWVVAFLLLFYGLVPGILWWWCVVQPERVHVALCKDHGFPDTILYRGADLKKAKEVARTVADVTGLPYR